MNAETLREWVNRRPFEPFELRISNGEVYRVRHSEVVAIGRDRIAVYSPEANRFAHVALIHINSIEALQTA